MRGISLLYRHRSTLTIDYISKLCYTNKVDITQFKIMVGIYKNQNRGIYKILNIVNNKCYVGSTSRIFGERWCQHKTELNNNKHSNSYLQNAWNKYGKEAFVFVEQERLNNPNLSINQIREREQYWIDNLQPEYNLSDVALYGEMTEHGKYRMIYKRNNRYHLISPKGIHYCTFCLAWFAEEFGLHGGTLQNLCNGKIHQHKQWKGSIILEDGTTPHLYSQKKRTRNYYHLVSPKGIHMCVENIKEFCKENNLSYAHMVNVCNPNNKRRHHKQWTGAIITKDYTKPTQYNKKEDEGLIKQNQSNSKNKYIYTFISPNNEVTILESGVKEFCNKNNLTNSKIYDVAKSKLKHTKGWKVTRKLKV